MPGEFATHPLGAPGSPQALANGCLCPVLDNAHGAGIGGGHYWIAQACTIHNNEVDTMPVYTTGHCPHGTPYGEECEVCQR